ATRRKGAPDLGFLIGFGPDEDDTGRRWTAYPKDGKRIARVRDHPDISRASGDDLQDRARRSRATVGDPGDLARLRPIRRLVACPKRRWFRLSPFHRPRQPARRCSIGVLFAELVFDVEGVALVARRARKLPTDFGTVRNPRCAVGPD